MSRGHATASKRKPTAPDRGRPGRRLRQIGRPKTSAAPKSAAPKKSEEKGMASKAAAAVKAKVKEQEVPEKEKERSGDAG